MSTSMQTAHSARFPKLKLTAIAVTASLFVSAEVQSANINLGVSCSLADAIVSANTNASSGGCVAGDLNVRDTINLMNSSTITLSSSVVEAPTDSYNGLPLVSSDITIAGNNSILERDLSADQFRILYIDETGDLSINSLTVRNGLVDSASQNRSGGGILNHGMLSLESVTVNANTSNFTGGGISNVGGSISISNSVISNNSTAIRGGGFYSSPLSGNNPELDFVTITDSTITLNNSGFAYAGVLLGSFYNNASSHSITGSTISNNSASAVGGGIGVFVDVQLSISNSHITGNSASNFVGGLQVTRSTVGMTGSTVSGNSSTSGSGGIRVSGFGGILTIGTSEITLNSAGGRGGGITVETYTGLNISDSELTHNYATGRGGAIFVARSASLTASSITVQNNSAAVFAAGIASDDALSISITGSTITENTAYEAIELRDTIGSLSITNTQISNNVGRGLTVRGPTFTMAETTIDGNSGGGVSVNSATITNSSITNNSGGGGLDAGYLNLDGITISGNSGQYFGGLRVSRGQIANTQILNNFSSDDAGGLLASPSTTVPLRFSQTQISNNTALQSGGGVKVRGQGMVELDQVTISGNSAATGGGVYVSSGTAQLSNSTLSSNHASAGSGGAVLNRFGTSTTLANSTISGNSALNNGGGAYIDRAELNLVNATMVDNYAGQSGHAMALAGSASATLSNSVLASSAIGASCNFAGAMMSDNVVNSSWLDDSSCDGNADGDPLLGILADNGGSTLTHLPKSSSLLADAGDNAICESALINNLDQLGKARPLGNNCSIGAVEVKGSSSTFFVVPLGTSGKVVIFDL